MAGSSQVRFVIELFCKILEENHLCAIRAETLRQAKFNKTSATQPLWKLLFSVVCFCKHSSSTVKCRLTVPQVLQEEEITLVKSQLQTWGYLNQHFARLPHDFSFGSRELLLALGWVIQTQLFFDKVISARSCPLQQELIKFVHPELATSADRLPFLGIGSKNVSLKEKIQLQLMLCGKLRLSLRRVYMAHQQLVRLKSLISKSTQGVRLQDDQDHLSLLEVHLLRHPADLKKMMGELDRDNAEMQSLLYWRDREPVFWEWMDSALRLHLQEKSRSESSSPSAGESVYLPAPEHLDKQVALTRARLRDFILQHETDIEQMENIILRKKVSPVELETLKQQMDVEISQLRRGLQSCGRGWGLEEDQSKVGLERASPAHLPGQIRHQLHLVKPKYGTQTAQAERTIRHTNLLESAKMEILNLEKSVHQLEAELRGLETENLRQLQAVVGADGGLICVQPRYCQQLVNGS